MIKLPPMLERSGKVHSKKQPIGDRIVEALYDRFDKSRWGSPVPVIVERLFSREKSIRHSELVKSLRVIRRHMEENPNIYSGVDFADPSIDENPNDVYVVGTNVAELLYAATENRPLERNYGHCGPNSKKDAIEDCRRRYPRNLRQTSQEIANYFGVSRRSVEHKYKFLIDSLCIPYSETSTEIVTPGGIVYDQGLPGEVDDNLGHIIDATIPKIDPPFFDYFASKYGVNPLTLSHKVEQKVRQKVRQPRSRVK